MRRELVILRHAKSDWPVGVPDRQRPLAARGRRDAPVAGRWLRAHVPTIDLVLCSTAKRARQTYQLARKELAGKPTVRHEGQLYAASAETLAGVIRNLPRDAHTVLLIGHNPGLEDLVELLTGQPCTLKTAAVAVLTGSGGWTGIGPGWAKLATLAKPRG
ncbi:histidine phosphatase family protein [Saccharomonospora sp. NPDC046836]|uniref:SixA phosphatase family protein n=1 Tax=Saccharomonospora sp. NPDC046836 TaxID=3156921 RepID=UPI0033F0C8BB